MYKIQNIEDELPAALFAQLKRAVGTFSLLWYKPLEKTAFS